MPTNNSKPCHNCRRRRLRCDRSWPSCHKCAVSGQECLGYGKVFVWTQALDKDGNSRSSSGRSTPAATAESSPHPAGRQQWLTVRTSGPSNNTFHAAVPASAPISDFDTAKPSVNPTSSQDVPESLPVSSALLSPTHMTDPVFQDLDRKSRYYLAHFANRVCQDLVARDTPNNNPFRQLIPLTNRHPLLLHILVATSALHWSNIFSPITALPGGLSDPNDFLAQLRCKDLVSRKAVIDALTAKQKAMGHLRQVLDTLDPAGSEVALAAMHFFIKFDLIDVEKNDSKGWQAHLEGASSILALLSPETLNTSNNPMLRDCVIADCFIYHILGSTVASGALAARIARYAFELLPVMKRVEVNSYLSCPPELLQIILSASQLSYQSPCMDSTLSAADEALELIDQALAFDIPGWASQLQQASQVGDLDSRIHVASAHRSAACLYILQALPLIRAVRPVDTDFLVDDILGHLSHIGEADPYFKASSWPAFIAGAETRDAEKRTWTMKRLVAIWAICPWGYVFTAIEMLKATWQMQDLGGGKNWLQDLKAMGFDYLIV